MTEAARSERVDTSLAALRRRRPGPIRRALNAVVRRLARRPADGLDRLLAFTDAKAAGSFRRVEASPEAAPRHRFTAPEVPARELAFGYLGWGEVRRLLPVMPGLMLRMLRSGRYYRASLPTERTPASPVLQAEIASVARAAGAIDVAFLNDVRPDEVFGGLALPAPGVILFLVEMDAEPIAQAPSFETFHEVATGYRGLAEIAEAVCDHLQARGHAAFPGTALGGTSDYVALAERAGMGGIGFHGMLLTPAAGARVRIGTVYTNLGGFAERAPAAHAWVRDFCARCRNCVRSCPPAAIHAAPRPRTDGAGTACIDHVLCRDYFARSLGCAKCIAVCPFSTAGYAAVEAGHRAAPVASATERDRRRFRVAVVGAGAAGLFVTQALLHRTERATVDVFERLPMPFGLVRYGVAPDHPEVRSKVERFGDTLVDPRVRFFGNVALGRDVSRAELRAAYDAVVYATGASDSRRLGVAGEEHRGVVGSPAFVGWVNGHPDHTALAPPLDHGCAVVVGAGNVALDVLRMLASDVQRLAPTDVSADALQSLRESHVRELVLLARGGPERAAFTPRELRDLAELPGVSVVVRSADLDGVVAPTDGPPGEVRRVARNLALLREMAREPGPARVVIRVRFGARVERILADASGRVTGVAVLDRAGDAELPCGLVVKAIGFRSPALPDVPHDPVRGVVPTDQGRVLGPDGPCAGEYASGWVRRGARGIIGANKRDAEAVVACLLADLGPAPGPRDDDLADALRDRGVRVVDAADWDHLRREERLRGSRVGRVAVRHAHVEDMLASLDDPARLGGPA